MPDDSPTNPAAALISEPAAATLVVVRAAVAPMHAEPRVSSPQTSQALAGHVLLVRAANGDWLRAAGRDGYAAWVHRGYLTAPAPVGGDPALDVRVGALDAAWATAPTPAILSVEHRRVGSVSLGCVARWDGAVQRPLPLGAWVQDRAVDPSGVPHETIESGVAVAVGDRAARFPPSREAIARSASELFVGASYQWGGVTPWGADCSGFVQAVYRLHGVELPRDAWQQALVGEPAANAVDDLAVADLLFFSDRDDGRITHVGIALGGSRMAHVALGRGGFAVERLDDAADPYVARLVRQRRGVRRLLG